MEALDAIVQFPEGDCLPVKANSADDLSLTLALHGVQAVRQHPGVLHWHDDASKSFPDSDMWKSASTEGLAPVCAAILQKLLGESLPTDWTIGNVIIRDAAGSDSSGLNTVVHRDYCHVAMENMSKRGISQCYNLWVPLLPVTSYPLGFVLPSSVDWDIDVGPFTCLAETDRTSLRASSSTSFDWRYFPDLRPGDVLIWRSDLVFHSALCSPNSPEGRRLSVDLRLHWGPREEPR